MNRLMLSASSVSAAALLLGGCGGSSGSNGGSSSPAPSTTSLAPTTAANPLVGTWQTPSLPVRTWEASFRKAGGSARDARDFVGQLGGGSGTTRRIIARISASQWIELEQADQNTPEVGYNATYTTTGSVVRVEGDSGCRIGYRMNLQGNTMRVRVLYDRPASNPDCGPNDLGPQRTIWETATFTRVS